MTNTLRSPLHDTTARDTTGPASQSRMPDSTSNTEDEIYAKERRRQQNRIAQRNHRKKRAARNALHGLNGTPDLQTSWCQHCGKDASDPRSPVHHHVSGSIFPQSDIPTVQQHDPIIPSPLNPIDTLYMPECQDIFETPNSAALGAELLEARNQDAINDEEPLLQEQDWVNNENLATSLHLSTPLVTNEAPQRRRQAGNGGQLALHLASKGGFSSIIRLLLRNGALLDAIDGQGKTALHYAAEAGHMETTQVLLSWGADTTVIDSLGLTSLQVAASKGHEDVVLLLIDAGADPN